MHLDADAAGLGRVLDGVIAQVPEDLAQVAPVHADFQVVGDLADGQFAFLQLERPGELVREFLEPGSELQPLRAAGVAARQLQHILNDVTDAA